MPNPKCTECGAEIVAILPTLAPTSAPVIYLECSGASLSDFVDDEEFGPDQCQECGHDFVGLDDGMCPNCDY